METTTIMKNTSQKLPLILTTLALALSSTTVTAAEIRKINNGDPLDSGSSWFGGVAPTNTDVALWDGDSGTGMASPSTNLSWGGIRVLDMNQFTGGSVQFPLAMQTLGLGEAGIDLSASQHDVDFLSGFVSLETNQVWHVGRGRVLTLDSENGTGTGGLWKVGPGVLRLAYDYTAASHLNDAAPLGLAGGTVRLDGSNPHAEVVGSTLVYGDATRIERWGGGSTLVLNSLTRFVSGTVDFMQPGIALTSSGNDASAGDGILGGWATVNFGQDWAQVAAGGGNQSIDAYPMGNYSTEFEETNNVSLSSSVTVSNMASFAINSLRFGSDAVLTLGSTTNVYSLTNLSGGILMSGGAFNAAIVSSSLGRTLRGPAGGDLIFHVPHPFQTLSNQVWIRDNANCGLTKAGMGTLLLNPSTHNEYRGLTTINGGTLQTGNVTSRRYVSSQMLINPNGTYLHGSGDHNLNLTAITVNGGTLNLNGRDDSCPNLLLANNGFITGFAPGKTFTVGSSTNPLAARCGQIDVALNAPGGIVKTTDRKLVLSQSSTITGDTRVENGALQVVDNATVTLGSLILGTATNNAKLVLGGTNGMGSDSSGAVSVTNLTVLNPGPLIGSAIVGGSVGGGNMLVLNLDYDTHFDLTTLGGPGPYEQNIGLMKAGSGTLLLTNASPFFGGISVLGGVVKLSAAANIQNHSVSVQSGLLDVNGFSPTFLLSSYAYGNVHNSATTPVTLTIGGGFDGVISDGSGEVSVLANGLQLNGLNTYSGGTTISNTSLALDADATIGSGTLNLAGGSVVFTASSYIGISGGVLTDATAEFTSSSISASAGTTLTVANDTCCLITNLFEPRFSGSFSFGRPIIITNATYQPGSRTGRTRFGSFNTNGTMQTYSGVLSGNGSFRRSASAGMGGVTVLTAANTYTGETLVDNGTLLVTGALATNVVTVTNLGVLGGNGTIRGPVLVLNGGTLAPGTSIGRLTISNALVFAGGSTAFMELNRAALTNDFVTGLTSVTYGGTLSLTNVGPTALAAGDSFKLFNATNYSGAFTNLVPATPGAGLVWDTTSLTTNGILKVAALPSSPIMDNASLVGTNFIASGTGGLTNGTYYVLTSTNAALPLPNWTYLATNTFDANGNFSFTNGVSPAEPQRFFILRLP
jgi:fibronectin-binding autotransporter adhesin